VFSVCVKSFGFSRSRKYTLQIMEVIECIAMGKKILLNGYVYTKKATKKNRIRWKCSNRAAYDCKGAITTSHQVSRIFIELCDFQIGTNSLSLRLAIASRDLTSSLHDASALNIAPRYLNYLVSLRVHPATTITFHSFLWFTLSNAFSKSTKHMYSGCLRDRAFSVRILRLRR